MIYPLVSKGDPILKTKLESFSFSSPPINPVELYNNLAETLIAKGGLGLAAPQVGLSHRCFVLRAEQIIGCYNPIIVDASPDQIELEEGCLSFPGLVLKISRPRTIRVRYAEPNGEINTRVYDGMTARAFQHELDHLNGILFGDRVSSRLRLQDAIARSKTKYLIKEVSN